MASSSGADRILQSIAANVQRLRVARGWTQKELGEKSGVSWRSIQVLETGQGNPSVRMLIELASALRVAPTDLYAPAKLEKREAGRPPLVK